MYKSVHWNQCYGDKERTGEVRLEREHQWSGQVSRGRHCRRHGADGGSQRTQGENFSGRRKFKHEDSRREVCFC